MNHRLLNTDWLRALGADVHVWPVRSSATDASVARLRSLLSADELERADRFRFEHLCRSFAAAHGCLRILLGRYLAVEPDSIRFEYGEHSKPAVAEPRTDLHFSISHSGEVFLFAFAVGCEIGVDVEEIRPLPEMAMIAERYFCPEEAADLLSVSAPARELAFFGAWTRKEAYVKAVGAGLYLPFDAFRVTLLPEEEARLVGDAAVEQSWQLHALDAVPGYSSALAYRGERRDVHSLSLVDVSELLDIAARESGG